jgi:hypothetical protein
MGTSGDNCNHAFNALADDKMVAALRAPREDGSINVEEQIKDLMLKPGKAIADAKLPISEVQALYIKGIDAALNKRSGRNGRGMNVLKTAYANMPTVELTAQEVVDLIASQIDQLAAENFNADYLEELKKDCAGAVDAELLKTKDTPELVMADTNWGSSTSQTFFVVRTDPRTGELKQYIKKMPEGTLSDLPKNWKDGQWQRLEG